MNNNLETKINENEEKEINTHRNTENKINELNEPLVIKSERETLQEKIEEDEI